MSERSVKTLELLAPARDYAHGCAAIDCGADALYVGAPDFGARRGAAVDPAQIARLCDYAHRYRARVYVTMNTLVFGDELRRAEAMAREMYRIGADALIVQDAAFLRMDLPPVELHASTQMFNMDPATARFWSDAGFTRIIVERAASLREIAEIAAAAPEAEIEAFIHGAICVGYSGRCFMSRSMGPRSGNRGECSQSCRLPYDLLDGEGRVLMRGRHLLSVQDMNLSGRLGELVDAGVGSFKIEGRLKDIAYVRNIVAWYRAELDAILAGRSGFERPSDGVGIPDFTPDPSRSFSRGSTFYFLDGPRRGIASFDTPKSLGEPVGTVRSVERDRFSLSGNTELAPGDGLCLIGPQGRLAGTNVNRAENGVVWPNRMDGIAPGMKAYRNYDHTFVTALKGSRTRRAIPVSAVVGIGAAHLSLTLDDGRTAVTVTRDGSFDEALNAAKAEETIRSQVSRTGDTIFTVTRVGIDSDAPRFVPASVLGALRREATAELERARTARTTRRERRPEKRQALFPRRELSGDENVVNPLARQFYTEHGVGRIEPGYDLSDDFAGRRVMRMRYCLRREIGQCLREGASQRGPLFIRNGSRVYELQFDCSRCEMSVVCPDERKKTTTR